MSITPDAQSEENLQGSWVELHFSGAASQRSQELVLPTSTQQQDDVENMLLDAQHESGRNSSGGSSQCNSPCRALTPPVSRSSGGSSLQSDEDLQERRQEVELMMKKNADWIWDWSSRPENNPPKEFLLKHPKRSTPLSIRNSSVMRKGGVLSPDFLQLFLPSLIISHILAIGLGIYIGKRLTSHSTL
ncbi:BCL2 interacting protein 4 [Corythoichthys intestinalis]|uniref:BCL2 interacting protein 4 n=1 Tax=Corythoichthys intestinalis TaxID=161448 RepID=UPI0025A63703|nr:BCL2 interacting protein 4 [Corythoichthys intestinalis]XP_061794558.1 BCL2/adenovirus E1B 19 kDa protein-interacting protein 3 [Nerophis lumbriciformis]